ncbi:MAG: SDR family NAD(P)-dependent oxidoreductase [Chloroflexi bacterium]|nr:SDR family NAD(P)-dependent oxidoreductase [Chloroflexota bacterium]
MRRRVLVTGATGFLGSHLAGALARAGHQVRILRRQNSRLLALREQMADHSYETVIGDLLDRDSLAKASTDIDWLFHTAAVADYLFTDEEWLLRVNIEGTRNVLEAAWAAGVQRVIFTSSASAIGPDPNGLAVDETAPFRGDRKSFPYAWSKFQAEQVCAEFMAKGLDVVILNPAIIIGPGDLNLIAGNVMRLIQRFKAFTPTPSGGATLIDVRDVAQLHLIAAENASRGERYLLGTESLSAAKSFALVARVMCLPEPRWIIPAGWLNALIRLVEILQWLGVPIRVNIGNLRQYSKTFFYDCRKAHQAFGLPKICIRQSLADSFAWYQRNGYTAEW